MNQDDLEAWRAQIDLITELKELERLDIWMSINLPTVVYGVLELNLRARRKVLLRNVVQNTMRKGLSKYIGAPMSKDILNDVTRDLAVFGEAWIEVKKP